MQTRAVNAGDAYTALTAEAAEQGLTITELARNLVWRAHAG